MNFCYPILLEVVHTTLINIERDKKRMKQGLPSLIEINNCNVIVNSLADLLLFCYFLEGFIVWMLATCHPHFAPFCHGNCASRLDIVRHFSIFCSKEGRLWGFSQFNFMNFDFVKI